MNHRIAILILSTLAAAIGTGQVVTNPGAQRLDRLRDVNISSAADGEVLAWDATSGRWINSAAAGSGDITGVAVSGGLLTGGGTSGDVTVTLSTNSVRSAVTNLYAALSGATMTGNLDMGAFLLRFGASPDMEISHGGGGGSISTLGTEALSIGSGDTLTLSSTSDILLFPNSGAVSVDGTVAATALSGAGSGITGINASNLASGTVPTARLGSGTASSSTFLRGDQTWATPADAMSITIPGNAFSGPLPTETVGWKYRDEDDASQIMTGAGVVTASGTQATGTLRATFRAPQDASGFRTTNAIQILLLADSITTTVCKYRVNVISHTTVGTSKNQVYTSGDQTFASTTDCTVHTIDDSSLGTFVAGGWYTIEVELLTASNNGAYIVAASVDFVR